MRSEITWTIHFLDDGLGKARIVEIKEAGTAVTAAAIGVPATAAAAGVYAAERGEEIAASLAKQGMNAAITWQTTFDP